jgi:molybdopterin biosynthesis enzyme MoaB
MPAKNPTACLLVIGNEVLSGRTRDANIQFLATGLGDLGIPLRESDHSDVPETIVATVNEVRAFDYVFTTGGIGPTHATSPAMRRRGVRLPWSHTRSRPRMEASYKPGEFNTAVNA